MAPSASKCFDQDHENKKKMLDQTLITLSSLLVVNVLSFLAYKR